MIHEVKYIWSLLLALCLFLCVFCPKGIGSYPCDDLSQPELVNIVKPFLSPVPTTGDYPFDLNEGKYSEAVQNLKTLSSLKKRLKNVPDCAIEDILKAYYPPHLSKQQIRTILQARKNAILVIRILQDYTPQKWGIMARLHIEDLRLALADHIQDILESDLSFKQDE